MKLLFKYTAVILTFLLLFGTVSIYASELSNKKNELNKVQSQISQQQKKLAQTKQKEKNVLAELNSLEKQIVDIQKDLKIINNDLTETQKLVDEAEKSLAITAEKLNQHTDQLNARVKEMYIHGNIDYLEILLNAKNQVIDVECVSEGTLTASLVHPREVFKAAIRRSAHAVILAHNHPSGDPTPSREDREITRRLVQAGRVIGIEVLDHLVVGQGGYTSFRERGLLTG